LTRLHTSVSPCGAAKNPCLSSISLQRWGWVNQSS